MQGAPPTRVELVEATDWLDEFASEREHSSERLGFGDSTDELEAFAAAPDEVSTDADVTESRPPRVNWMTRVRRAVLVCSVLAAAAAGAVILRMPAAPLPAVVPPMPAVATPTVVAPAVVTSAIDAPAIDVTAIDVPLNGGVERAAGTPPVVADPTPWPAVDDAPSVPPVELRRAPAAALPADVEPSTATVAAPATTSAAAPPPTRDAATSASIPPPAVTPPPVAAAASATASSPTETSSSSAANAPRQAAAQPSFRQRETRAVEDVLGRYRDAFNRLDARAATVVWPTVDGKTLARAFERLEYQNVFFASCQVVLGDMFAEATCIGSTRHEPKVGSRATKPEARRWRFDLRKAGGAWLIDRVDMR